MAENSRGSTAVVKAEGGGKGNQDVAVATTRALFVLVEMDRGLSVS